MRLSGFTIGTNWGMHRRPPSFYVCRSSKSVRSDIIEGPQASLDTFPTLQYSTASRTSRSPLEVSHCIWNLFHTSGV